MGHEHHSEHSSSKDKTDNSTGKFKLAFSATFHCLLGCGLGEVAGIAIGIALGLSNVATIILAVSLGFVFGFALGLIPLLRARFLLKDAIRQVFVAEGLSIVVMETAEVLVEIYTPGVMSAGLGSGLFWGGPDFVFGLSALIVGWLTLKKIINHRLLMVWNIIGLVVILFPTMVFMSYFMNQPGFIFIFEFPMVLAPSVVVPLFLCINTLLAWNIFEKTRRGQK